METQGTPPPTWKFWHPLPFWQMLVVFLVVELAVTFSFVALRELVGVDLPQAVAGGVGGGLAVVAVFFLANRRRKAQASAPPGSR